MLVKGVMFDEKDSLVDMQRSLYENFIYSMCLGLNSVGDKTKTEHWESYINKTAWAENAQRMFTSGFMFNQKIADALDMNYHDALKAFNQERNRYTKGRDFWPKELIDQPRVLSAKDVGADLEIRDLPLIDYYSLEDMMLYFRAPKKWVNDHIVQKIHKRDTGYFSGKAFYKKTAIEGIARSWPDYNPQKNLKRGGAQ